MIVTQGVSFSMLARNRAESFRWLAAREEFRRTLTREECHVLAREADQFAAEFERLKAALVQSTESERQ